MGPLQESISRRTSKSTQSVTTVPAIGFMTHTSWRIKLGHKLHSWECLCTWHFHGRSLFCGNGLMRISVWRKKNIWCGFTHSYASKVVRAAAQPLCLPLSPCSAHTWASPRKLCWAGGRSRHASQTCILTCGTFNLCRYRTIERNLFRIIFFHKIF